MKHSEKSHLLQMRGLKLPQSMERLALEESHLLQMRGLKPIKNLVSRNIRSRIFYRCVD